MSLLALGYLTGRIEMIVDLDSPNNSHENFSISNEPNTSIQSLGCDADFYVIVSFAYGKHNFFHICIIFSSYLTIIKEFEKNWVLVYRPEQTRIGNNNNNNNNVIKIWWKITIYYYKFMVRGLHNAILYCCCYYYYYYFNIYGTLNIKNKIKKK